MKLKYGQKLELHFQVNTTLNHLNLVHATVLAPPFNTLIFHESKVVGVGAK